MSRDEWDEYSNAPNSYKDALYASYKKRERVEKDWEDLYIQDSENALIKANNGVNVDKTISGSDITIVLNGQKHH